MNTFKLFASIVLFFSLFFTSCNTTSNEKNRNDKKIVTKKPTAEVLKDIEVDIEGMTCEIGCARLIESKLSKTAGIKHVKVNFDQKLGRIEYNENEISKQGIIDVIQKIAGGDLYKVKKVTDIDNFSSKS